MIKSNNPNLAGGEKTFSNGQMLLKSQGSVCSPFQNHVLQYQHVCAHLFQTKKNQPSQFLHTKINGDFAKKYFLKTDMYKPTISTMFDHQDVSTTPPASPPYGLEHHSKIKG